MFADKDFIFKLADASKSDDRGQLYVYGRIGVMVPEGGPVRVDGEFKDLAAALAHGRLEKFAIASPDHAPYGTRAKEALQHAGLWQRIEPFLVFGENISQTALFATCGSTQGGIIAYFLALAPRVARLGDFTFIPESWHKPLVRRMVVLRDAPPAAWAFYDYFSKPEAQAIMLKYGFTMPNQ